MSLGRLGRTVAVLLVAGLVGGCSSLSYLAQSAAGHLELLRRARPVADWVADPATEAGLRARLQRAQQIRDWAVRELALPEGASYRRYAALDRPAAVWNVVAAPELSLKLKTWCFPIVGCVSYQGHYDRAAADAVAAELKAGGWEVAVYAVPAYSTLGWLEWLGGDPLLSTFIGWPEGELARLIFHELAHQVAYAKGDTVFNESYATAVERIGVQRWLAEQADDTTRADYERFDARRRDFRALTRSVRAELAGAFDDRTLDDAGRRAAKARAYERLHREHARLKAGRWDGFAGYERWLAEVNNARLAVQGAYDELVPAFESLYERLGRDMPRFHAEVRRLADLPPAQRLATLRAAR